MKSSTGEYFIGLDHVRAFAVLLVYNWHFLHIHNGQLAGPPVFPLSLFTEGHTGVAIFMTLSGYLFAKLLNGKDIDYRAFIWNRIIRLAPLLLFVLTLVGIQQMIRGESLISYIQLLSAGLVRPLLPSGGWSITVEFHFYLILPVLLFAQARWKYALVVALACAVLLRVLIHQEIGQVQSLSYYTIIGRIDQFLLGMLAFEFSKYLRGRHAFICCAVMLFAVFYWYFDKLGGYYTNGGYPSATPIWIYMPTIEGLVYASIIGWYDTSFKHSTGAISKWVASIGTYSYSIYLLHFFVVWEVANVINWYVCDLSNINTAILFANMSFLLMVPLGYAGYRVIETPALAYRTRYIRGSERSDRNRYQSDSAQAQASA